MILIFVASLNENVKLANKLQEQLTQLGKKSEIVNLVELNLPMYHSLKEENDGIPEVISTLIQKMNSSEAYMFVSPEYNFSLPPTHVNFIAWVSRAGDDFRKLFNLKTIQLATHSGSGGNDVSNAMRTQFTKLGSIIMPREIITTYKIALREDSSKKILKTFVNFLK